MKRITLFALIVSALAGCEGNHQDEQRVLPSATHDQSNKIDFSGNYVTADYLKRQEGYDWVAVSVKSLSDSVIHVSVRSRADRKKPTCTFDADATRVGDSMYTSTSDNKVILYSFKGDSITISTENSEDNAILNFYCSGGGSIANSYNKINEPLDEKQIDKTVFTKTLVLLDMGYDVRSVMDNGKHQLILTPFGFAKEANQVVTLPLQGEILNAEIEDMDADGFPEVVIYDSVANRNTPLHVMGFSPNKGKSLSAISFPSILDNPQISKGYDGNDQFAIVEQSLVQRFKIYDMTGSSKMETGKMRQVQYKLKRGEASKQFVIDKVVEF